ncbi:MAG: type II toxin-antitoxin system mRNA interferase toxin, RelE/StbE family [Cardiobacteriaceae bacterium]|nr:type II toxin-antitoxin system mRNA interferase toxin, RelE/StbE family [Cardiobacteriaceae bacterium]
MYCTLSSTIYLSEKYKDHALQGNLRQYRECHLKADLLLAYQITDDSVKLITIYNHNKLFKTLSNR